MTLTLTAAPAVEAARPRTVTTAFAAPPTEHATEAARTAPDIVEIWGRDSFPASDAPANW